MLTQSLLPKVSIAVLVASFVMAGCSEAEPSTGQSPSSTPSSSVAPSTDSTDDGLSEAEIEAEIDRVVAETRPVPVDATREEQVAALVQCAEFLPDQRYCLVYGWTTRSEADLQAEFEEWMIAEEAGGMEGEPSGDLLPSDMVAQMVAQSRKERAAAVRAHLISAAKGREKAQELQPE